MDYIQSVGDFLGDDVRAADVLISAISGTDDPSGLCRSGEFPAMAPDAYRDGITCKDCNYWQDPAECVAHPDCGRCIHRNACNLDRGNGWGVCFLHPEGYAAWRDLVASVVPYRQLHEWIKQHNQEAGATR